MTEVKGNCRHGEFVLNQGCPQCVLERLQNSTGTATPDLEAATAVPPPPAPPEWKRPSNPITEEPLAEVALALRPGEDIEVRSYFVEAEKLLSYAMNRVINSPEQAKEATTDLSIIAKIKKGMEAKRREYLEPLKVQADAIRETYTSLMAPLLEADKVTRSQLLSYNAEQERIRKEQEEINRKRQEAAEAEMKLKGELSESVNLVEVAPPPVKTVRTDMGTAGMTDSWKYEVFDFPLLPDAYKVADNAQLNAIARSHHDQKPVPGVRFYNEPFISVRAKSGV